MAYSTVTGSYVLFVVTSIRSPNSLDAGARTILGIADGELPLDYIRTGRCDQPPRRVIKGSSRRNRQR